MEVHFADEEGDPYAVELAGRIGGYVVGNDSDFVIFNSDGYKGYIPLNEMVWNIATAEPALPIIDDDDFQTVRRPKRKSEKDRGGRRLLPPDSDAELAMTFTAYSPGALASFLKLPVTLLPLLGALVGNDFSKQPDSSPRNVQSLFFERQLSLTRRIEHVAATVRSVLSPAKQKHKERHQVGSVMDLIDRTVKELLVRHSTIGSGEVNAIVDKIVDATLQYAIPRYEGEVGGHEGLWPTDICALHEAEVCPILPMISRRVLNDQDNNDLLQIRESYLNAYRDGHLSPKIMDVLSTGSSWSRLFLENPDLETVGRSIGRPLQRWIYAILDDAMGLPDNAEQNEQPSVTVSSANVSVRASEDNGSEESSGDDGDEDELIDVIESDSEGSDFHPDFLAPLKGELQRLHSSKDEEQFSFNASQRTAPIMVMEYGRRGTRITPEPIRVQPMSELLFSISSSASGFLPLKVEDERMTIFFRILNSNYPSVRDLPAGIRVAVLALRWVVSTLHSRAQESPSRERERERWTNVEARCFLASFIWGGEPSEADLIMDPTVYPPIDDRNVQLTAQVLMALEGVEHLAEVLLLVANVPTIVHRFSGMRFHALLTGKSPLNNYAISKSVWDATQENITEAFQIERTKKTKKSKRAEPNVSTLKTQGIQARTGLFALLQDAQV